MKKLFENWRKFVNEAKFEAETTELTRKVVKYVKSTILPYIKDELKEPSNPDQPMPMRPLSLTGKQLPQALQGRMYEIAFKFYIDYNIADRMNQNYSVGAAYGRDDIDIEFSHAQVTSYLGKDFSEKDLSGYLEELKTSLIHELQHSGQTDDVLNTAPDWVDFNTIDGLRKYYASEAEVDAKAKELYKLAKMKKIPFSEALDKELEDLKAAFTRRIAAVQAVEFTEQELESFLFGDYKQAVIANAKKNYPAAQGI